MKPLIGITPHYDFMNKQFVLNNNYVNAIEQSGGVPVVLPFYSNASVLLELIDGLLVTGGGVGHVTANMEKKDDIPSLKFQNPKRYDFESFLIKKAYEKNIPVLGICRGCQMINEVFGGTTNKSIKSEVKNPLDHQVIPGSKVAHKVIIAVDSFLFKIVKKREIMTNSVHLQSIKNVAPEFRVCACSSDGVIEGIERLDKRFVLGLQFHPEKLLFEDYSKKIFSAFIKVSNDKKSFF